MNNKNRITLVSFLAYFVMSGMLTPMGIISGAMSEHFGQPVTEITARFSWLTVGVLVGAVIALFIFDLFRLRKLLMALYGIILASLISLLFPDNLFYVGAAMGLVGVCCAIGLAGAALVISRTYDTERRASMLVITDGSFSVAGFVCSWIAIFLIGQEFHWSGVYQFIALIAAVIIFLSLGSTFPTTEVEKRDSTHKEKWPLAVWLCIVGLFLYTLGQWSFLLWLPTYAETELGAPREQAGQLAGQFWAGMFVAQIFVAWWVLKVGVPRLVMIAGVILGLLAGYTAIHFSVWRYAPELNRWLGSVLAMTPAALLFVFGDVIGQISVAGYVGVSLLIDSINGDCGCEVMAIPGILFNKRTHLACLLFSPLDWLESKLLP